MDIPQLRVFNVLHKLKIPEKDFKEIEDEVNETDHTGIAIMTILPKCCIYINHDDHHKIIIGEKNDEFKPKQRLLLKCLIQMWDIPQEIYDIHTICRYHRFDHEFKHKIKTLEKLKDKICDRFVDGYPKHLGGKYVESNRAWKTTEKEWNGLRDEVINKQLSALDWLFGKKSNKRLKIRENIEKIVRVYQRNNRRVAIFVKQDDYKEVSGSFWNRRLKHFKDKTVSIRTYRPSDEEFNYVCPGRELYRNWKGVVWMDDDLLLNWRELEIIAERMDDRKWLFLTMGNYNELKKGVRLEIMRKEMVKEDDKAKEKFNERLKEKFKDGDITKSGITFNKKYVICNGVKFLGNYIGEFIIRGHTLFSDEPDFADIINNYIDYVLEKFITHPNYGGYGYGNEKKCLTHSKISVGKIKLVIRKKGFNYFVNNIKIKNSDLSSVLKTCVGFQYMKECTEYLETRSKINLEVQRHLDEKAISMKIYCGKTKDNIFSEALSIMMALPLKRETGKNYVRIGKRWLKVKNMPELLKIEVMPKSDSPWNYQSNEGQLQRIIRLLLKSIENITYKDIGNIIKIGEIEFKILEKQQKEILAKKHAQAEEFLEHAVRLTKATLHENKYFVTGKSGTHYVLDGLMAYRINEKEKFYLCLIDFKNRFTEYEQNEGIAKRLLMLSNDTDIAREVYARGDRMDRHWGVI